MVILFVVGAFVIIVGKVHVEVGVLEIVISEKALSILLVLKAFFVFTDFRS